MITDFKWWLVKAKITKTLKEIESVKGNTYNIPVIFALDKIIRTMNAIENDNTIHIVMRLYASENYVYNIVPIQDLQEHVEYNTEFRPGCILYIDGIRVYNGCMKDECLDKYDKIADKVYEDLKYSDNLKPSEKPYQ